MQFEWDETKNRRNFEKHGIRFEDAVRIFSGATVTIIDDRFDYNELREVTFGALNGVTILAVTHTDRDGTIRLISARRATQRERKAYGTRIQS